MAYETEVKVRFAADTESFNRLKEMISGAGEGAGGGGGGGGSQGRSPTTARGALTALVRGNEVNTQLLGTIAGGMIIVAAFFEAVGPFLKIVVKLLSALILIVLLPLLKPALSTLINYFPVLVSIAQFISVLLENAINFIKLIVDTMLLIFDTLVFLGRAITNPLWAIEHWQEFSTNLQSRANAIMSDANRLFEDYGKIIESAKSIWEAYAEAEKQVQEDIAETNDLTGELVSEAKKNNQTQSEILACVLPLKNPRNFMGFFSPANANYSSITHGPSYAPPPGTTASDFLARSDGTVLKFSEQDNIIGVKDLGKLGGGMVYAPTFNIKTDVDENRIRKIIKEDRREANTRYRARTSQAATVFA